MHVFCKQKNSFEDPKVFSFKYVNIDGVKREINNINIKRATPKGDIPFKILKSNSNTIAPVLTEYFNQNTKNSTVSNELKHADIFLYIREKAVMASQITDQ